MIFVIIYLLKIVIEIVWILYMILTYFTHTDDDFIGKILKKYFSFDYDVTAITVYFSSFILIIGLSLDVNII